MQMMFRVTDLDKSIQYYTEALGMKHLRTRENEKVHDSALPLTLINPWSALSACRAPVDSAEQCLPLQSDVKALSVRLLRRLGFGRRRAGTRSRSWVRLHCFICASIVAEKN